MFNTAILFLVFNRLETTKQVFFEIRKVKPLKLYVAADGAKHAVYGENEKVNAVRDYILQHIDWNCEVKTLFRDQNLGCKYAVSGAIDWFFSQEDKGIILEDDCLPNQSFFTFCEQLLHEYENEKRIWQISGDNFQDGKTRGDGSYYFSNYNHIWGWASWADRWQHYHVELQDMNDVAFIKNQFGNGRQFAFWNAVFQQLKRNEIDTWDHQWAFTVWQHQGLTALPNVNLITNIGFGDDATHTFDPASKLANKPTQEMDIVKHPSVIAADKSADNYSYRKIFKKPNLFIRIVNRLKKLFD